MKNITSIIISLIGLISNVSCMPGLISQFTSTPLIVTPGDQEGIICGKAMCKFNEPIQQVPNSYCYKYKFCTKCSVSNVPDHPVCYLLDNDPQFVHLMEGHIGPNNNAHHDHDSSHNDHSSHFGHDEGLDHDEDSFLQTYDSSPMGFITTSNANDFEQGRRSCAVDAKGNIMVRVRLIIQWYGTKDEKGHHEHDEEGHDEEANYLQIGSKSTLEKHFFHHHHEDDDEDDGHHKSKMNHMAAKFHKLKGAGKGKGNFLKSPKAKVYLMFSNPKVTACRTPLIYKGKIDHGSMFVAKIEPTIPHLDLSPELIKSSIQVILSCKGCDKLKINSCVQVTCAKNAPNGPANIPNQAKPETQQNHTNTNINLPTPHNNVQQAHVLRPGNGILLMSINNCLILLLISLYINL